MRQVNPGEIYYYDWGYNQTQIDFVVVLEVSKTGKSCICQRAKAVTPIFYDRDVVNEPRAPTSTGYGDTFRLLIKEYNNEPELIGQYPYHPSGIKRDGTQCGYFTPVTRPVYYETVPTAGH